MVAAEAMVSELAAYKEYKLVQAISVHLRIKHSEVLQLTLDDAMQAFGYIHHNGRVMSHYKALKPVKE